MEVKAVLKGQRMSSLKMRVVADRIRGVSVEKAFDILSYGNLRASSVLLKLLESVVANAENNHMLDIDDLTVSGIFVDEGQTLKRMRPRAKGRGTKVLKRSCHVTIIVSEK